MNTTRTSDNQSLEPLPVDPTFTSPSPSPKAKSSSAPQPAKVTVDVTTSTTSSPKAKSSPAPQPAKVTVEIPATSPFPVNPFDPTWIKFWEQVGPTSYLGLMCLFVWLLTRLVQTVKGK